jgi:hypothetical protein
VAGGTEEEVVLDLAAVVVQAAQVMVTAVVETTAAVTPARLVMTTRFQTMEMEMAGGLAVEEDRVDLPGGRLDLQTVTVAAMPAPTSQAL